MSMCAVSCEEIPYYLIQCLRLIFGIRRQEMFVSLNLPKFLVPLRKREKLRINNGFSAFNQKFTYSKQLSTVGALS